MSAVYPEITSTDKDDNESVESIESSVNNDPPKDPEDENYSDEDIEDSDMSDEEEDEDDTESVELNEPAKNKYNSVDEDHDEDEDEEDDEDENYLQKFDDNVRQNIIGEYHPELIQHNDEEVETLCKIVKDSDGNIVDPLHKTVPFITKYEKARILGERAKQINSGAQPFIKLENNLIDGYLIALREFEEKKIPFIIRRPLPNGGSEYWKLTDLEYID